MASRRKAPYRSTALTCSILTRVIALQAFVRSGSAPRFTVSWCSVPRRKPLANERISTHAADQLGAGADGHLVVRCRRCRRPESLCVLQLLAPRMNYPIFPEDAMKQLVLGRQLLNSAFDPSAKQLRCLVPSSLRSSAPGQRERSMHTERASRMEVPSSPPLVGPERPKV